VPSGPEFDINCVEPSGSVTTVSQRLLQHRVQSWASELDSLEHDVEKRQTLLLKEMQQNVDRCVVLVGILSM